MKIQRQLSLKLFFEMLPTSLWAIWFRGVSVFITEYSVFITQTQNSKLIIQTPLSLKKSNTFVLSQNSVMYLSF